MEYASNQKRQNVDNIVAFYDRILPLSWELRLQELINLQRTNPLAYNAFVMRMTTTLANDDSNQTIDATLKKNNRQKWTCVLLMSSPLNNYSFPVLIDPSNSLLSNSEKLLAYNTMVTEEIFNDNI